MSGKVADVEIERFFLALADRTRLRLLNLMGDDEVCVCDLVEVMDEPQPKISRHLAYLRRAGIVAARREGRWMHYRITPPAHAQAAALLENVRIWWQKIAQDRHERLPIFTNRVRSRFISRSAAN
ncbi:MAG: ArsR/SmtB family transcription factor, partial [Acidobacteriota bacterium]